MWTFDIHKGFTVDYIHMNSDGYGDCCWNYKNDSDCIGFTISVKGQHFSIDPIIIFAPTPYIKPNSPVNHLSVGDDAQFNCSASCDEDVFIYIKWTTPPEAVKTIREVVPNFDCNFYVNVSVKGSSFQIYRKELRKRTEMPGIKRRIGCCWSRTRGRSITELIRARHLITRERRKPCHFNFSFTVCSFNFKLSSSKYLNAGLFPRKWPLLKVP